MKFKNSKLSAAFTLVELMIVIVIIAVLATIALISFQTQASKGNDAKRKSDINRIKIAVEEYEKDNNCYPSADLVTCTNGGTGLQPYLDKIPCDPSTNASYYYDNDGSVCPRWYRFYTELQYSKDSQITLNIGPNGIYNFYSGSANAPTPSTTNSGTSTTSTPAPTGIPRTVFYGCINNVCVQLAKNSNGDPVCKPYFDNSSCNGTGNCNVNSNACITQ